MTAVQCRVCDWRGVAPLGGPTYRCRECGLRQTRAPIPTRGARLAFDLDGTIFDTTPQIDYEDRESILAHSTPNPLAIRALHVLRDAGYRFCYVTGRNHKMRHTTMHQLLAARAPAGPLYTQATWEGYEQMSRYKADVLRETKSQALISDHDADERAAVLAGVPFHHARILHERTARIIATLAPTIHDTAGRASA